MTDRHGRRIVAVVVTFNRLELLQRQLARLAEVPELDEILVVDNASTDGTAAWLRTQDVTAELLESNTGGAGGFARGLALAIERGADLAWLMDDDGLPAVDCLTRLLECGDLDFWGPVVVDEADPERLVFPIRLPGGTRTVRAMADVRAAATDGLIRDVVIPFNGVLVTRELVERIGVPRAEFFIWGDDVEYLWRAEAAGARIATVTGAVVHHPSVGELGSPMMLGRTTYNFTPSDLKHYCMARNNTVNLRRYRGWPYVLMFWAKTLWFFTLTRPRAARLSMSARAAYAGLRGDFTGHRRYLR
ncbi:MAG TPA: glycosyltransferase family 2 protein [Nocardioides sp.]|mgnify:CR=1 FL=1|uniref:glycosyltransferase family 2 protein n=1 Tax=uncultured Nocardioides sp. TaxID=198441 RepID=UPI00262248E7|nr:glycosyltransferase family 2 protein [uncultured Nocardioides sp.]HRD62760.1 glycosyltransferase family 2 protein [Nocardioides sp.]HRI97680.1 glycosyltransferase family 2 protein [Nocardioides sp.]HRK47126.1 glycosyltransferase family 2 protein [Nocardioides sp.]